MKARTVILSILGLTASTACAEDGGLVDNSVRLALDPINVPRSSVAFATALCETGASACTPENLSGRIYSGNVMWGELGPGASAITVLGANEDVIQDPSHGLGGTLEFSLLESTTLSGAHWAPGSGHEQKRVPRMEFNYDYLDATLTLASNESLSGTYVIRTVFASEATADDVSGTMRQGDKLIRRIDESAFAWCNETTCSAARDEVELGLIQETKLVQYEFPGEGNPNYIPFSVPLANELMLTGDELSTPGSTWSVVFDMTNAVILHAPPEDLSSPSDLLAAFELSYSPDRQHGEQMTDISVELSYVPSN